MAETAPKKTTVLVADDHEVVREGTRALIAREANFEVCGMARDGREAVEMATKLQPDIVVLDVTMPELDGVEVVRQIRRHSRNTRILIFSGLQSEEVIAELFQAGIKSYIRKGDPAENLVAALHSLAEDKPFFTPGISDLLFSRFLHGDSTTTKTAAAEETLSSREREILRLVAQGGSNKSVAAALGVSTRTVETHRAAIMRKLHAASTAELVRYAIRNGIIEA
jgi:DNA-binding NarL/FixJ family response regulator